MARNSPLADREVDAFERVRLAAGAPVRFADTGDVDVGSRTWRGHRHVGTAGDGGGVRVENHSAKRLGQGTNSFVWNAVHVLSVCRSR